MHRSSRFAVVAWIFCVGLSAATPVMAQVEDGFTVEQIQSGFKLYTSQCVMCHGNGGDGIPGINLARQQFKTVFTNNEIMKMITTGNPAGMPPFNFKTEELTALVAYIRSGLDIGGGVAFKLGDAARGKAVYAKSGCAACHRILSDGARTGPDLSEIGLIRKAGQLQTSLTDPNKGTWPLNRPITIVTNDGRTIRGRRLNEDTQVVHVMDEKENMVAILRSDIRSYNLSMTSNMPSYKDRLSKDELADLLSYLLSLKGQ